MLLNWTKSCSIDMSDSGQNDLYWAGTQKGGWHKHRGQNKSELTIKTAWCWQEFSERMNSISEFSLSLGNLLKYGTLSYKCNLKSFHYLLTWTYFYNIIHSKVIQSMPILWRFISYPHKVFPNHVMVTDTFVNWMNTAVNSLFRKKWMQICKHQIF